MRSGSVPSRRLGICLLSFLMFSPWLIARLLLIKRGLEGWSGGYYWVTDVEIHTLDLHVGRDLYLLPAWIGLVVAGLVMFDPGGRFAQRLELLVAPMVAVAAASVLIYLPAAALGGWLPRWISLLFSSQHSHLRFSLGLLVAWGVCCLMSRWITSRGGRSSLS